MIRPFRAFLLAVALLAAHSVAAEPDYPAFSGPVVDAAGDLSPGEIAALRDKVEAFRAKSGIQFAVATVPSLDGLEIEPYANGLFRKWGVGDAKRNDGLLLLVAPTQRKLRFEVGYGLEGLMTDAQSKLILHNDMVPRLKKGDLAGALDVGVDDAVTVLSTDKSTWPDRLRADRHRGDVSPLVAIVLVAFFLLLVFAIFAGGGGRGRGSRRWSSDGTSGGWSGGGSSSSGGGFDGGGGGSSGGGGASDSY